ncbi:glycosyltransferase family 2 protein [Nonlabens sp.]|uniref:glycosyltransferase family 2 protein n=1 Tax=Nonlabens sp. TaxID=1888209 RepID=UPI003F69F7EE
MNKLVSIVLPTYNGNDFLKKSIDSCLTQTYQNIELIIVNDCSTDNTEEIILSYKDHRIKYIKNETNQRLPRSLNIGFNIAYGDYLTWTSDDNFYKSDAIEKMVFNLENENADLVFAPYFTINNDDKITGERKVGKQENVLIDNVVKACFLYKKEMHQKLEGYNPSLFLVEDYDFWIRAAFENYKFSPLQEKLYYYRFHDNSLTETRRNDISKALFGLLKQYEVLFRSNNKSTYLKSKFYMKLASLAIANNESAFEYYKKGIIKNPISIFRKITLKIIINISKAL